MYRKTILFGVMFFLAAGVIFQCSETAANDGDEIWADGLGVCTQESTQTNPRVIADGSGGSIVVWRDYRSRSSYDIYVQKIDRDGNVQWTAGGVPACITDLSDFSSQLISDGSGGAIVSWNQRDDDDEIDIYAQRVDVEGNVRWDEDGIGICTAGGDQVEEMISDGSGGAIFVWEDKRSGTDKIYIQRVDADGNIQWGVNGTQICDVGSAQSNPQLIPDGNGGAIITWQDTRSDAGDIYAKRIDHDGNLLWSFTARGDTRDGVPICNAGDNQIRPGLTSDGSGGAIIVWQDLRDSGWDIYAQRIDADGNEQWLGDGVAICTADEHQNSILIVSDGSGGAIIVWEDERFGNDDIYAQRVNADGVVQWDENGIAICTDDFNQNRVRITSDGKGGAIITWHDDRSGISDVYAQRININGGVQWTENGLVIFDLDVRQERADLAFDGTGGVVIVCKDNRDDSSGDIYAQKLMLYDIDPLITFMNPGVFRAGVTFSHDYEVSAVSYLWNFGDGETSTSQNTAHYYSESGVYIVSLTVVDSLGNSGTSSTGITVTVLSDGLQGNWSFEEAGRIKMDNTTNNNHLNSSRRRPRMDSGRYGNAVKVVSKTNKIKFLRLRNDAQTGLYTPGDMTISAWINIKKLRKGKFMIFNRGLKLYVRKRGRRLVFRNGPVKVVGIRKITRNQWHHVAVVRNGDDIELWLDGVIVGVGTWVPGASVKENSALRVGKGRKGKHIFAGLIDELAVWNRALSRESMERLYNDGISM